MFKIMLFLILENFFSTFTFKNLSTYPSLTYTNHLCFLLLKLICHLLKCLLRKPFHLNLVQHCSIIISFLLSCFLGGLHLCFDFTIAQNSKTKNYALWLIRDTRKESALNPSTLEHCCCNESKAFNLLPIELK